MALEIERKFLVRDPAVLDGREGTALRQGYLPCDPPVSVRVRIGGERAWLTIKIGLDATRRHEYEYPLPLADAEALLRDACDGQLVEKLRYAIDAGGRCWEVDAFLGANAGLLVAEVELEAEDAPLDVPPWVGEEVTGDARLLNASLFRHPFAQWPQAEREAFMHPRGDR